MNFYKYELSKYKNKEETNEWTSICDINKIFDGKEFTNDMYLEIEDNYLRAIKIVMEQFSIQELTVMKLEKNYEAKEHPLIIKHKKLFDSKFIKIIDNISEGDVIKGDYLDKTLRAVLREVFWCKFYSSKLHFVIDVGYDFYVNITCPKLNDDTVCKIINLGLYLRN